MVILNAFHWSPRSLSGKLVFCICIYIYKTTNVCMYLFPSQSPYREAMICRIITTSFSFNNYTSKVTSKASSGICLIKPPWGQSWLWQVCQYQNAQDQPDMTNAITAHLLSSPATLSRRVARKCYTTLTTAAPGTVTSSPSHSTQMNLACLFTDLPSDLSFNWQENVFMPSFFK